MTLTNERNQHLEEQRGIRAKSKLEKRDGIILALERMQHIEQELRKTEKGALP